MALADELCNAWRERRPLDQYLFQLVLQTQSRASGCWRLVQSALELVGFGRASDMPIEVSLGFQSATRRVALDQVGLGIVKAAVSQQPAIGRRDAQESGLSGSASWIHKFAANSSLAVPIFLRDTQIVDGVVAVSTAALIQPGDELWVELTELAKKLGQTTCHVP